MFFLVILIIQIAYVGAKRGHYTYVRVASG